MNRSDRPRKIIFLLLAAVCLTPFLIGCGSSSIDSTWPKKEILANGKIDAWEGLINYSLSDQFGIGVANDDRYLYICAVIEERPIAMQMLRQGMTAWFETSSSKNRLFGIHFPLGNILPSPANRHRGMEEDTSGLGDKIEASCQQLEILGPGKHDSLLRNIALCEPYGIQLKFCTAPGEFLYQARIPLYPDSAMIYAIDPGKDSLITLHIECPAPEYHAEEHESSDAGGQGGGMGHGGGMGGGHGMGGGGMGGGGGGMGGSRQQPQPIDAKLVIKLAAKPAK
jgi:uncharacterized membrane protein YgcG